MARRPDREDPQRGPGRPRRRRQDDAGRSAAVRRRRDPPYGSGRGPQHRRATSTPRSTSAGSRSRSPRARSTGRATRSTCIDAPGYADFVGDVAAALPRRRPRDLRGVGRRRRGGADRGSRGAWPRPTGLPRAVFVNKLDRERASFPRTLDDLKAKFGAGIAPLELPDRRGSRLPRRRRPPHRRGDDLPDGTAGRATGPGARRHGRRGARGARRARRGHRRRRRRPDGALPRRRGDRRRTSSRSRSRRASPRRACSPCCAAARRSSSASTASRTSSPRRAPRPRSATARRPRSCSRRSSTPTSGA